MMGVGGERAAIDITIESQLAVAHGPSGRVRRRRRGDRQGDSRAGLRTALNFLARGWTLGIFPEGTHRTGEVSGEDSRAAKSGTVLLAVRAGAPVVPVFVGRSPGLRGRLRGEKLHVYVGDQITLDPTLRGREEYRAAADEVLRTVYALPGGA